jgi:hypothetical protein
MLAIRNTDVSPLWGFGINAACLTVLSDGLNQLLCNINLAKVSAGSIGMVFYK